MLALKINVQRQKCKVKSCRERRGKKGGATGRAQQTTEAERHRNSYNGATIPPKEHNGHEWRSEKTNHQSIAALWRRLVWHTQPSVHLENS